MSEFDGGLFLPTGSLAVAAVLRGRVLEGLDSTRQRSALATTKSKLYRYGSLGLFFLIVSAGACLQAQQAAPGGTAAASTPPPVLPPGPLLKPMADNTRWTLTITVKPPAGAAPAASPGQSSETGKPGDKEKSKNSTTTIIGERMGKMAHQLTVTADGGKEEKWTDGMVLEDVNAGAPNAPIFTTGSIGGVPTPSWISRENFADLKTQGEKSYLIFRDRVIPTGLEVVHDLEAEAQGTAQNTDKLKVDAIAVIDGDTRWPVAVTEGNITTAYKFESLPPGTQIIPAAIQAALAEREKRMRELIRKPVHP